MNQFLPAAVYIPFVGSAIRNYAVLHIPVSEVRVFQTKERSPFVICLEVFRPDELNQYSEAKKFHSGTHKMSKRVNRNHQINFDADTKASNPIYIRREGSVQRSFVSDVETTQSQVLKNEISRSFSSSVVKSFTTQSDHARQNLLVLDEPTDFKQPESLLIQPINSTISDPSFETDSSEDSDGVYNIQKQTYKARLLVSTL